MHIYCCPFGSCRNGFWNYCRDRKLLTCKLEQPDIIFWFGWLICVQVVWVYKSCPTSQHHCTLWLNWLVDCLLHSSHHASCSKTVWYLQRVFLDEWSNIRRSSWKSSCCSRYASELYLIFFYCIWISSTFWVLLFCLNPLAYCFYIMLDRSNEAL